MRRRLVALCVLVGLAASCGGEPEAKPSATAVVTSPPKLSVRAQEAYQLLRQVADRVAQRTPEAVAHICGSLAETCDGMSRDWRANPTQAPRTPPSLLCDIPLPGRPGQAEMQVLVVQGRDATGRAYVGQVLVKRIDGRLVLHEPTFWLGIRYTSIVPLRAWEGAGEASAKRQAHEGRIREACRNPAGFVASVIRPASSASASAGG